uniref:Polysaccharide biosynthesis enzyme WcbI domain-containing protein n=1 Tax=viral metagenome TaxID=1070528 RepID=A0A6C0EH21_9ZZZZ
MINILFYGNCQTFAVQHTLSLSSDHYNIQHVPCWTTDTDKEKFTEIVKNSDIIITQPINDNYRDLDYLSTSYIINNKKTDCKTIIFDSCYFDFYYFDLTYKNKDNNLLREPIDYHYNNMIECYNNNLPIEYYIENYANNYNLKSSEELEIIANESLNELNKRYQENKNKYNGENINIISTEDFIKNNYKNKLLFYSMNHPTKYVTQYICEEIINILNIPNTINYEIDLLPDPKCIIYKCIQKNVNFDINNHPPLTLNKTNIHDISQLYYDTYKKIGTI